MANNIVLWANNAKATLASSVSTGATTVALTGGEGALFPTPAAGEFFPLTLQSAANPTVLEITYCTARSGDTLTVTRAEEGTSATAFSAGDNAQSLVTAGTMPPAFTASHGSIALGGGTVNWTAPLGVFQAFVKLWGPTGGGGGALAGAAASGAGAAGYCEGWVDVTPGSSYTIVVPAGGAAGTGSANGAAASGPATFASVFTANPGAPGFGATSGAQATAGAGGTATGGTVNLTGQQGQEGFIYGTTAIGGQGGGPYFFPPTQGTPGVGQTGSNGGGGGGGANGQAGGAGGAAICFIYW